MRALKQSLMLLGLLTCFCLTAAVILILVKGQTASPAAGPFFPAAVAGACIGIAASFLLKRKISKAELIIENKILGFQYAVTCHSSERGSNTKSKGKIKSIDAYVSCFGILLDRRVIPFNQNSVRLKSILLGNDSITLSYGSDKKTYQTKLLCNWSESEEQDRIAERFLYETGISAEKTGTTPRRSTGERN